MVRTASVASLGDNFLRDAVKHVTERDNKRPLKVLKSRSDIKSRDHLLRCGFGKDQEEKSVGDKGQLEGLGHRKGGGAHSLPSLTQILNEEDVGTREQMIHVLKTFAEDYSTVPSSVVGHVDVEALDKELNSLPPEGQEERRVSGRGRGRHRRVRATVMDVRAARRWPSADLFDKHYLVPHSAQRVLSTYEDSHEDLSAGLDEPARERRTISRIEDALSPEELAMLPPLEGSSSSPPATALPSTEDQSQTVRIFEASEVYRQVCEKFGLSPLAPVPFFGDTVEIDAPLWGARHCYAVAAAIRMCAPRDLELKNNLLTDAGAAKVLEMMFFSPRAEKVHIEGSSLGYRSMNILHSASKANFAVSGMYFRACGLGSNIDLDDLPEESFAYEACAEIFAEVGLQRANMPAMLPLLGVAAVAASIRHLDISHNVLSDEAWSCFLPLLRTTHLELLVIDNCLLENRSALILAQGIESNTALQELRMRQNCLKGPSAWIAIFQALALHQRMAHFDCSENNLLPDVVDSICYCLKHCQTLCVMHLLSMDRDAGVRKALLTEMHLVPDNDVGDQEELVMWRAPHVKNLGTWHAVGAKSQEVPNKGHLEASNKAQANPDWPSGSLPCGCWICERRACRWFKWAIPESGAGMLGEGGQIFVLPSFAGFARVELQRAPATSGKSIVFTRDMLVPPGSHFYVFEFGGGGRNENSQGPVGLQCAKDQSSIELESALSKLEEEAQRKARIFFKSKGYTGRVNTFQLSGDGFQIPEGAFDKKEPLVPVSSDKSRKDEAEWKHRLRNCFEADIQHVRMQDLCHADEQIQLEQIIWGRYSTLYEVYAIFAGRSTFPFIRQMDIYDFFEAADIMEKLSYEDSEGEQPQQQQNVHTAVAGLRQLTLQDIQQLLTQTMAHKVQKQALTQSNTGGLGGNKKDEMSEKRAAVAQKAQEGRPLARPEFLELILRLSICLFGREHGMLDSLKIFVDKVLVVRLLKPPLSPFPKNLMWTSEVNAVFIEHTQTLHAAHERFGRNANSFIQLAQLMKLYDKTFTAKNVCSLFALARQPHVDAWETKGTKGLTFVEFGEALVRFSLVRRNQNEQEHIFKDLQAMAKGGKDEPKALGFHNLISRASMSASPAVHLPDAYSKNVERDNEIMPLSPASNTGKLQTAVGGKFRDQVRKTMGSDTQAVRHRRFATHVSRFLSNLKERMKAPKILGA